MKKLTITGKITLWYTVFMVLIAILMFILFFNAQDRHEKNLIEVNLMEAVEEATDSIEADDGIISIDEDLAVNHEGTYLVIYDNNGDIIKGSLPLPAEMLPEFDSNSTTEFTGDKGQIWYTYDETITVDGKDVMIRAFTKDAYKDEEDRFLIKLLMYTLPALMIFTELGGYQIARRQLKPIRQMINTAEEITDDSTIDRRLVVGRSHDELSELAITFNSMLDRIESLINRHKQFTQDVSHELRTPLTVIKAASEFSLATHKRAEDALGEINREADKMSDIIDNLLLLSRRDVGRMNLETADIDLSELMDIICDQQASISEDMGINIKSNIQPDVMVRGDEIMLMRAIINLIENARKYGVSEDNRDIDVNLRSGSEYAICEVQDYGAGIAPEHIEHIWDRFYQADTSRTDDGSSGLGLSLVKAIIEEHGGTVGVTSTPGQGSKFVLIIPLANKV